MLRDSQGLNVTTDSQPTITAINRYTDQALAYGADIIAIFKGVEADPECAIASGYAAAFYLSHESAESRLKALPYLESAQKYADLATEREQLFIAAVVAWADGKIDRSIAYTETITDKYPRDILAVQLGQYHYFYQGNKEALLQIAEKVLPANRENHYLHGMIAFGLEQCHRLGEAEAVGRMALKLNRNDPWAQHAVAHVMEMQGRLAEGIAWMESYADTWEHCNSMLYTHNWWHIALYYLEKADIAKVLEIYDTHLWGRAWKESPKDQVGVISLLLRLELRKVEVGNRWIELIPYLKGRIHEHSLPFNDLHYIYALARAGEAELLQEMLLSMQDFADRADAFRRRTWQEVAIPAARGMAAHGQGNWQNAIAQLGSTLSCLQVLGGSHAQHDLFEQVYLDAWLQSQENHQALHLLEKRLAAHRYVPNPLKFVPFPVKDTTPAMATRFLTQKLHQPTQLINWTENPFQSPVALSQTYSKIVAMGGYIGV
jgi:hypothetical protein